MGFSYNNTKYFSNQKRNVRENIWYKLYMLQNYNVTEDMFKGATMRWTSILCYMNMIRRITSGKIDQFYNKSVVTPSLIQYIQGLKDSGIEPYKAHTGDLPQLIQQGILTNAQVEYIYSHVGKSDNTPDTSVSSSRSSTAHANYGREYGTYSNLTTYTSNVVESVKKEPPKPIRRYKLKQTVPDWATSSLPNNSSTKSPSTTSTWGSWT